MYVFNFVYSSMESIWDYYFQGLGTLHIPWASIIPCVFVDVCMSLGLLLVPTMTWPAYRGQRFLLCGHHKHNPATFTTPL